MPRTLRCPACNAILGTVSRKHDHRGKPYERLKLAEGVRIGHALFRGQYAECRCGEKVQLPDSVTTVEFR